MDSYPLEQIRQDYVALGEVTYLNTGTVGIMSESVLQRHLSRIAEYERYGHLAESEARSGYEDARATFAQTIGATPSEIALTRNASDGVNFVLDGLDIPTGATLLTTDQEHPAVLLPMTLATRKSGGAIKMLEVGSSDDQIISGLEQILATGDVYLAVISHVSCETGKRLPIDEICRMCRDAGVLTVVDGAQSVGQFDVDVQQIDCDFMTGNGHKWLCGPKGTGFLYINQDRTDLLTPAYTGDGSIEPRFDRRKFLKDGIVNDWEFRGDAGRFEFGTRNWHLYGALADATKQLTDIGWEQIQCHVEAITSHLKSELSSRRGITVRTPMTWEESCGLVTFSVDGWDGVQLSDHLWKNFNIIQRRVQIPSGVRVSCAHYTSSADIGHVLDALDEVVAH